MIKKYSNSNFVKMACARYLKDLPICAWVKNVCVKNVKN